MWRSAVTAYLHYLGFMLAFGALVVESQTLKKDLTLQEAWRVVTADAIYGLSATMVLITGILRVLYFGKGTDYYLSSPVFYIKVGIFIVVSLLSLYPTFSFVSWVKGLRDGQAPRLELLQVQRLSWLIGGEVIGLALIPLFAAILARGIRLF
jgi:putative membrane protein